MFASNTSQVSEDANYIESCFSTTLYTGNGSTQTITNGIDLSGKGGLVWIKDRTTAGSFHRLTDTERGAGYTLGSNATNGQSFIGQGLQTFTSTGFSIGSNADFNQSSDNYVSWTLRKQPKFFDVVTYTGTGSAKTVAHNLGSVPGCIIVKATNSSTYWATYHTSLGNTKAIELNTANAAYTSSAPWNNTTPTATEFTVGTSTDTNDSGITYVAYLFAHNAGGFGLTGSDNVISCGSFTTDGSGNATIDLGWEPQWFLRKRTDSTGNWTLVDNMRGFTADGTDAFLYPNLSNAEATSGGSERLTSTGVRITGFGASISFIYIAIRRGPMKVPTSGTSVFAPYVTNTVAASSSGSTSASALYRSDFVTDFVIQTRKASVTDKYALSRLTGNKYLITNSTAAEWTSTVPWDSNIAALNFTTDYGQWMFQRAPSFFDEVCYTGTGSNITLNHNLGAVPELMIFKTRTGAARAWGVYSSAFGVNKKLILNTTAAVANDSFFVDTTPTATVFYPGNADESNEGGNTYVAYLFATCAGVSKVGSYTGTGTTLQVNCGFTGGARFVLIKKTSGTGSWYIWDSARGIVSGNDPYLLLNSTAAEVTNTDYIDTYSAGFEISSTAPSEINENGGSFIFLAIS